MTYGGPIADCFAGLQIAGDLKHMELVSLWKTRHNAGHGHADVLVAYFLATK
jgi:Domain of unknown function (DUF4287)